MKRYFGAHVSAAGGLVNAAKAAIELDINTIQIHPSAPQRWNSQPFAEGIEDEDTARRLKDLGCNIAQGYYFARPMPAGAVAAWLKQAQAEGRLLT